MNNKKNYSIIDMVYKVVLLGECGTGKSSMAEQYVNDNFLSSSVSTIGVDFLSKIVECGNKRIKIQIWDTAGQEKFHNLICSYFRDCCMAILVFDITDYRSFQKIDYWIDEFERYSLDEKRKPLMLVGSKSDAESIREVTKEEAINKAIDIGCEYIECSAKENINIEDVFQKTINLIYSKIQEGEINPEKSSGIKLHTRVESFYLHLDHTPEPKCCIIL
jgi:small GTP-binding protein